jgi:hypothetical protein
VDESPLEGEEAPGGDAPDAGARKHRQPIAQSIGGVLFGFEQQVWRNVPPPHELVHHARPDAPVPAGDGGFLVIELPGAGPADHPSRPEEPHVPAAASPAPEPTTTPAAVDVALADLDAAAVFAVRVVQPMRDTDVGRLVDRWYPELGARIAAAGLEVAGPPYIRYRDFGGETADVELGFPVAGGAAERRLPREVELVPGEPGLTTLAGGRAAVGIHVGAYAGLHGTWREVEAWIAAHGLAVAGAPWESYVDNPDLVPPELLRTQVVMPVRA